MSSTTTLRSASLVSESMKIGLSPPPLAVVGVLREWRGLDAGEEEAGDERSGETEGEVGEGGAGPMSSSSMCVGDCELIVAVCCVVMYSRR